MAISKISGVSLSAMSKYSGVSLASLGSLSGVSRTSNQPSIITTNLVQHLDAGDSNSYSGTGTTWFDLTSNNVDGTFRGSPTYSSTEGGGSFYFDGVDDAIKFDYDDAAPIRIGEESGEVDCTTSPNSCTRTYGNLSSYGGITFQAWVRTAGTGHFRFFNNNMSVTTSEATSNRYKYYQGVNILIASDGRIISYLMDGNGGNSSADRRDRRTLAAGFSSYLGSWANVAVVIPGDTSTDISNIKIYVQGVETTSYGSSGGSGSGLGYRAKFSTGQGSDYHGGLMLSAGNFANGYMAQTLMYNDTLTDAEVLQNFNATKTRYGYS